MDQNERGPYQEKLSALSKRLNFSFQLGRRPFQIMWALFDLRDAEAGSSGRDGPEQFAAAHRC